MRQQLEELKTRALGDLGNIGDVKGLEAWRVLYLGKKSQLTAALRGLAALPIDERKTVGALANQVKALLEAGSQQKGQELRDTQLSAAARKGAIDVTLPGRPY
ncbi:MAG: phenylalanine--tRNA ligase subunit alpha, partial [Chloroflexota bacterium]